MKFNRILVIGGSGLFGSCLKKIYQERVITIGRSLKNEVVLDYENIQESLKEIVQKEDLIIHAAWEINLKKWQINTTIPNKILTFSEELFSCCKKLDISFIFISSDQVYSGIGPHKENENINPINEYGKNKKLVEDIALKLGGSVARLNYLSSDPLNKQRGWVEQLLKMRAEKKSLELYENVFFSPCSGKFAAEVIPNLCYLNKNDIFNIGCNTGFSKAEIAENIFESKGFEKINFRKNITLFKDQIPRGKDLRMSSNKISNLLSIKPESKNDLINNIFLK